MTRSDKAGSPHWTAVSPSLGLVSTVKMCKIVKIRKASPTAKMTSASLRCSRTCLTIPGIANYTGGLDCLRRRLKMPARSLYQVPYFELTWAPKHALLYHVFLGARRQSVSIGVSKGKKMNNE